MGGGGSKSPPAPPVDRRTEIEKIQDEIEEEKKKVNQQEKEWHDEEKKLEALYELLRAARMRAGMNADGVSYQSIINDLNARIAACEYNVQVLDGILNQTRGALNQKIEQLSQLQQSYDNLGVEKQKADLKISDLNFEIQGPKGYKSQVDELNRRIYDPTGYIAEIKNNESVIGQLDISVNVLKQQATYLAQLDYLLQVDGKQELYKLQNSLDVSLNLLFDYLKRQNIDPIIIYEKINYREKEHEKLHKINNTLNILFYCFYVAFLIIIVCTGNTKREQFLIYLFVGLIPIIYPYLFKLASYIVNSFSSDSHGPKNAFININNTILGYNI